MARELRRIVLFACFVLLITVPAFAAEVPLDAGDHDAGDPPGVTRFEPTRRDAPVTEASRLRELRQEHARALTALREQLAAAPAARQSALQRRIEGEKLAFESRLLGLQIERAKRLRRSDDVQRLSERRERLRPRLARLGVNPEGGAR